MGQNFVHARDALLVPVGDLFPNDILSSAQIPQLAPLGLFDYRWGDYVYIDSVEPDGAHVHHGLMIVGTGPAFHWAQFVSKKSDLNFTEKLEVTTDWTFGEKGFLFELDDPAGVVANYTEGDVPGSFFTKQQVPYVVDWNEQVLQQTPRPFYATYAADATLTPPVERKFNHSYWLFVPAPDSGEVLCDWVFGLNDCAGAPFYVYSNPGNGTVSIVRFDIRSIFDAFDWLIAPFF